MSYEDLKHFNISSLMRDATGEPLRLCVEWIEPDPDNIRTTIDPQALRELADSIAASGLLQPISVRTNPAKRGHYLINVGERRWRAVQLLGHERIAAFVCDKVDPYHQAAENVQRQGLNAMDLARWIAKRMATGETHEVIAKRLGKARTFITEAAALIAAPQEISSAIEAGRVEGVRTAYLLAKTWNRDAQAVRDLLSAGTALTREAVESAFGRGATDTTRTEAEMDEPSKDAKGRRAERTACPRKPTPTLGVTVSGRAGRLELRPVATPACARVVFEDGTREEVPLARVRLTQWMT
jgi:ParB family chromosome partitioning protein